MPNWNLDSGYFLDQADNASVTHEAEFSMSLVYIANPFSDDSQQIVMEEEFELLVTHSVALDLLNLIPKKFWNSQILQDYVDVTELYTGSWLTSVRDIVKLLSPDTIGSSTYLRNLGALIGVDFSPEDSTTLAQLKKEVTHAIEWYKIKGSYKALQVIAMIRGLTLNLYDMYTNDYSTFYMVDWFVGNEDENPPGFDSTYYKSPHFGLEVVLNKVYESDTPSVTGSVSYLWRDSYSDNLVLQVDRTRPVHTVPHYLLFLNPKTDEFGNIVEVDGEIRTKVLGTWEISTKYFDMQGSGDIWSFDNGTYFDQSQEGFLKSIQKYALGTGNFPCGLGNTSFDIENPVLSGTIDADDIVITSEKVTYRFIVPKVNQKGLSELGLYIPGSPETLVVGSCFPKIDLDDRVELKIVVEIYRKNLS